MEKKKRKKLIPRAYQCPYNPFSSGRIVNKKKKKVLGCLAFGFIADLTRDHIVSSWRYGPISTGVAPLGYKISCFALPLVVTRNMADP